MKTRAAVGALILVFTSLPLLADEPLTAAQRKELLELPRTYRAADGQDARKKVLQRAVQLGSKAVARLRPIVEADVNRELGKYQPLFQRALATLASQAESKLTVENVLKSAEPLAQQRTRLLAAVELVELLGPKKGPKKGAQAASETSAENLAKMEKAAVQQFKIARSMQQLDAAEQQLIRGINEQRQQRGLSLLEVDASLCRAAKGHSHDMNQRGFFSHESPVPGKKSFSDRARQAGTRASSENIAKGGSANQVMQMWMKSDGHRRNILSDTRRIGVGRAGQYFTALFGR